MRTIDTLIDPSRREISTIWTTDLRVNEGTYDAGTVRVALTTSHDKDRKRLEVRINREVLTDSGFITRSFDLFAGPNIDAGLTLQTEPVARFSAKRARELHDFLLTNLDLILAHHADQGIAIELAGLLNNAKVAA